MNDFRLELLGSAAAGIAHDFNNQLSLIVNHLQSAQVAVERCAALTANLLAYCKDDAIALAPTCPASFLKAFAAELRLPTGIELRINVPAMLPAIAADTFALTRILTNLVSNASDAMDGRGTLRIAAAPHKIEVSDSGPGIPGESIRKIFDPFFTTKGRKGTGLGLAIVRDLMRQQGGSVTVSSEPGRGAQFQLHFRPA